MLKRRVLGLRLAGFVELVALEIVQAIDAIDEKINPIDEDSIPQTISLEKPAVTVQNLLIREKPLQLALVGGKSAHPSEKLPYHRGNQRENPQR